MKIFKDNDPKGIIFDCDGTILDSMGEWEQLGLDLIKGKRMARSHQEIQNDIRTLTIRETAEYFCLDLGLDMDLLDVEKRLEQDITEKYKKEFLLKKGVLEFLERNKHKKMCIATATERVMVEAAVQRLGIQKYFQFIITSAEVGNSKEWPDIYHISTERLGLAREEVVIFEDAHHAIVTAKKAGYRVIAVEDPSAESHRDSILRLADYYIQDFYLK